MSVRSPATRENRSHVASQPIATTVTRRLRSCARRACRTASLGDRHPIIVVDRAPRLRVPTPTALVSVFWGAAELILGDAGDISAEVRVVLQRLPRQRVVIVPDAEQAAEAEHRVGHLATDLVD